MEEKDVWHTEARQRLNKTFTDRGTGEASSGDHSHLRAFLDQRVLDDDAQRVHSVYVK